MRPHFRARIWFRPRTSNDELMGTGTGTDVCGLSGRVFSLRKTNPPSIPAPYKKIWSPLQSTIRRFTPRRNQTTRYTMNILDLLFFKTPCKKNTLNILCFKKKIFLSGTVRLSAVVLFFGMKTRNASISSRRYRFRYPFYVTLTWYGRYAQKLREKIEYRGVECFKKK
jgi:hypothetical protein